MATKIDSIQVIGRRWFESFNGNTYFSAEIFINNEKVHKIDFQYGYGDHYLTEAFAWLVRNERIDSPGGEIPRLCAERLGFKLLASVSDVRRKKDL